MEKEFIFTKHFIKRALDRGISNEEVKDIILTEKWLEGEYLRYYAVKIFGYKKSWEGKHYQYKEVKVIFKEENGKIIVITAIARYFAK